LQPTLPHLADTERSWHPPHSPDTVSMAVETELSMGDITVRYEASRSHPISLSIRVDAYYTTRRSVFTRNIHSLTGVLEILWKRWENKLTIGLVTSCGISKCSLVVAY